MIKQHTMEFSEFELRAAHTACLDYVPTDKKGWHPAAQERAMNKILTMIRSIERERQQDHVEKLRVA